MEEVMIQKAKDVLLSFKTEVPKGVLIRLAASLDAPDADESAIRWLADEKKNAHDMAFFISDLAEKSTYRQNGYVRSGNDVVCGWAHEYLSQTPYTNDAEKAANRVRSWHLNEDMGIIEYEESIIGRISADPEIARTAAAEDKTYVNFRNWLQTRWQNSIQGKTFANDLLRTYVDDEVMVDWAVQYFSIDKAAEEAKVKAAKEKAKADRAKAAKEAKETAKKKGKSTSASVPAPSSATPEPASDAVDTVPESAPAAAEKPAVDVPAAVQPEPAAPAKAKKGKKKKNDEVDEGQLSFFGSFF